MTEQQRCQKAATPPACLEIPVARLLTAEHVTAIRPAGAAYRHLFELRAIGPEWQRLAEAVAVVVLRTLNALEGSHP